MKPHRTDILSLVFGLLFVAVAGWWAGSYYLDWDINWDIDAPDLGWVLAGVLILVGALGIIASLRRDPRDPAATRGVEPVTAPVPSAPAAVRPFEPQPVRSFQPEPARPVQPEPGQPFEPESVEPEPEQPVEAETEAVPPVEPSPTDGSAGEPGVHRPE